MPELTVILAGVFGVGKSTIFKRVETGDFIQTPPPQSLSNSKSDGGIECYTYKKTIDDKEYNVTLWDTGGLERYNSMTSSYYRYCQAVILVYDASPDQLSTLFALKGWIDEARTASSRGERVILSLWGNKSDKLGPGESVPSPEAQAFMREYSIPDNLHYSVSALTGHNVMEALHSFMRHIDTVVSVNMSTSFTLSDPESQENSSRPQTWRQRICSKC